MVDEAALQARGLWTAFTPAGASKESSKGMSPVPNKTLGIPVDPSNAIRTLKDQYINEIKSKDGLTLKMDSADYADDGAFSFVVGFSAPPSTLGYAYSEDAERIQTPSFYVQFTLGEMPSIAFYVGDKLHSFKADDESYGFLGGDCVLESLTITEKELRLNFGSDNSLFFSFEIMSEKSAGAFNPKSLTESLSNIKTGSPFYEMGKPFRAFEDGNTTVYAFTTVSSKVLSSIADDIQSGLESGRSALWFNKDVNIYLSADSFTSTNDESKYLLPLSLDWGSVPSIDASKEHVEIKISMESAADATDNYTGRVGGSETLAATLIFPGDEAKLAPISVKDGEEVFCGQDGRIGRTLNDVKVSEGQVWLSFTDGTDVMFPHPEYNTLSAKDKITGQILTGKVLDVQKVSGSASEAYADAEEQRKKDNLDTTFAILDENGKSVTRALAWRDGEKNEYLKILVPSGKGAKMLTIKLTEA